MTDMKRPEGKHFARLADDQRPVPAESARDKARDAAADDDFSGGGDYANVGRFAGLMTGLIVVSRVTGFVRTWVMGIAFGVSMLASSYNIANNLPNMLYELVMGGMLVTAFLPVYLEARKNGGTRRQTTTWAICCPSCSSFWASRRLRRPSSLQGSSGPSRS